MIDLCLAIELLFKYVNFSLNLKIVPSIILSEKKSVIDKQVWPEKEYFLPLPPKKTNLIIGIQKEYQV